jgi:hypothetical protein
MFNQVQDKTTYAPCTVKLLLVTVNVKVNFISTFAIIKHKEIHQEKIYTVKCNKTAAYFPLCFIISGSFNDAVTSSGNIGWNDGIINA